MPSLFKSIRNTLKSVGKSVRRFFTARRRVVHPIERVENYIAPRRAPRINPSNLINAAARIRRRATMRRTAAARAASPPPRESLVHQAAKSSNLARSVMKRLHRAARSARRAHMTNEDRIASMTPAELMREVTRLSAQHRP